MRSGRAPIFSRSCRLVALIRLIRSIALLAVVGPTMLSAQFSLPKHDSRVGYPRWAPCFANVTIGVPQRLAVDWAYGRAWRPAAAGPSDEDLHCAWVSASAGISAGRLSIGWNRYYGPLGTMLFAQVGALRTFNAPAGGAANSTYVGAEFGGSYLVGISPRVGLYQRVGGGATGRSLVTWGIGIGF